ncbi:MAG: hypothetical protein ING66_09405 [Rhodocyclaceae bacterium]|jgi:hypothetical protein|nr:hypothetical protein [Rhodocyclaceae bacterium]MCA3018820.1 hypothetical protein [Rhodocyclaceae bacterium]MCA3025344.1 hypothetical protein [Rhodocyclaceae bacterium]MCA3028802.1 hypothetical protein [Rhodocyclaceae bacterium]MCA3032920.1 hypothetical protein [Rhodocyclaceae bacterium]
MPAASTAAKLCIRLDGQHYLTALAPFAESLYANLEGSGMQTWPQTEQGRSHHRRYLGTLNRLFNGNAREGVRVELVEVGSERVIKRSSVGRNAPYLN